MNTVPFDSNAQCIDRGATESRWPLACGTKVIFISSVRVCIIQFLMLSVGNASKSTIKLPEVLKEPKRFHPTRTWSSLLERQRGMLWIDNTITCLEDWLNYNDITVNTSNYECPCFSAHFLFLSKNQFPCFPYLLIYDWGVLRVRLSLVVYRILP